MAPIVTVTPSSLIPFKAGSFARSTTAAGAARRCFSVGIRVMPPPRTLQSSTDVSNLTASEISFGW